MVKAHFQKSLGLATEENVIMAATALHCLRRDGWGMVAQEKSECHPDDARYTRGVLEILPATDFLMYASLQRLPPENTPSLNGHYTDWLRNPKRTKWAKRRATIVREGRLVRREMPKYDTYPRVAEKGASRRTRSLPVRTESTISNRDKNIPTAPKRYTAFEQINLFSFKAPPFAIEKAGQG
ncbi:hypothetical protein ACA910_016531 [Epithemia clementina (nom. ined.)]